MELQKPKPVWPSRLRTMNRVEVNMQMQNGDKLVSQDAEVGEVEIDGELRRIRFHDYNEIYKIPGLYEHIFYERLQCNSPSRVIGLMHELMEERGADMSKLRVLDLGAGNGMVGDELDSRGVDRLVGADIIPEAKEACYRDRPGLYKDYFVADFTDLTEIEEEKLRNHKLNAMTSVAALGFGDIPAKAFLTGLDIINTPAWLAFNIKETFMEETDETGFSMMIQRLARDRIIRIEAYRRYRHRISVTGRSLYYIAVIARKLQDIPDDVMSGY